MKKTRLNKLLLVGLGNVVSGMFFGAGCIIIEHADNTWWHADKDTSQQEEVASDEDRSSSTPAGLTAVKSSENNSSAPGLASRRAIK